MANTEKEEHGKLQAILVKANIKAIVVTHAQSHFAALHSPFCALKGAAGTIMPGQF